MDLANNNGSFIVDVTPNFNARKAKDISAHSKKVIRLMEQIPLKILQILARGSKKS